jgi:hypothetical protein
MRNNPILSNYVSEIDQFMQAFDQSNPEISASQKKEISKYQRIYFLRDTKDRPQISQTLWDQF